MRHYQTRVCQAIVNSFAGRVNDTAFTKVLATAATGAGKTVIASCLIEGWTVKQKKKVLFLADTDELCDQSISKLYLSTGIIADLEKASSRASRMAMAVVASIQSMQGRLAGYPADHFGYVIADEAHMSMAAGWQKTLNYFHGGGARILGITATPERGDKQSLMRFYEHIAAEVPMAELIREKHLSPIVVETVPLEIRIESHIGSGDADNDAVGEELEAYYSAIIDAIEKHAADRKKFLIFHPSVAASKRFTSLLRQRGHTAAHVDGSSPDRAEIIEGFSLSRFRFLNNCAMLTKGFDCPDIDCVIILSPTKSRTNYIQKAGRGTRLYCPHGCTEWCDHMDRKENCLILDFLWEFEDHDVMGPADLLTDAPQQKKELAKKLKEGGKLDLLGADAFVTGEREADLLAKLKRQSGKTGTRVDALQFAALLHQPGLLDYEPVSPWESQAISPAQGGLLEKLGLDPAGIKDRGQASKIIDVMIRQETTGRASLKQIYHLTKAGVDNAAGLGFHEASRMLDKIFSKR